MESDARTSLQNFYRQVHIHRKGEEFEQLKAEASKYLDSVRFEEKFFIIAFEELIKAIISRKQARKAEDFLDIQKGFSCLEKYGLKLLQCPWRKEFHSVKLYSSYFKHNVETAVPMIVASPLLRLYGYKETAPEILELESSSPSFSTFETAFELFLSTIELEVLYKIAKEVAMYTDKVSLEEVLKSRVKTIGNYEQAKMYLLKMNGISSVPKRIKLDVGNDQDEQKLSKTSNIAPLKYSQVSYPPDKTSKSRTREELNSYPKSKARVELISSTNGFVDKLSDMELYGVEKDPGINPAPTFTKHYPQAMDIDDSDLYVDMSGNNYDYQHDYLLHKPMDTQQLPPPSYNQAVDPHFPGNMNEWVMVSEPVNHNDANVYDIQRLSGLRINENSSSNSNGVKHVHTLDQNMKSTPKAFKQEQLETRGFQTNEPNELMYLETAKGLLGPSTTTTTSYQDREPSRPTTAVSYSSPSNSKKYHSEKNDEFDKGYEKRQTETRVQSEPRTSSKSSKQLQEYTNQNLTEFTSDHKRPSSSSKRSETSASSAIKERSSSTRDETTSNGITTPPVTNMGITQAGKGTKTYSMLSDQEQIALTREGISHTNESEKCLMCGKEATYMCGFCSQVSCEQCKHVLNSLSCETSMHQLQKVEKRNEKPSNSNDQEICYYCEKPSTHKCHVCHKKACSVCHLLKYEDCTSTMGHVFRSNTSNDISISYADIQSQLNESNICDFCRLEATFICGDCHNRSCKSCKKIFEKDLCTKTKKAHYFHLIISQTKIDSKDKSWSCKRCTYNNPPQNKICAMCATSRGVTALEFPKSGSRKCQYCTYGNAEGATICQMCSRSLDKNMAESYI